MYKSLTQIRRLRNTSGLDGAEDPLDGCPSSVAARRTRPSLDVRQETVSEVVVAATLLPVGSQQYLVVHLGQVICLVELVTLVNAGVWCRVLVFVVRLQMLQVLRLCQTSSTPQLLSRPSCTDKSTSHPQTTFSFENV